MLVPLKCVKVPVVRIFIEELRQIRVDTLRVALVVPLVDERLLGLKRHGLLLLVLGLAGLHHDADIAAHFRLYGDINAWYFVELDFLFVVVGGLQLVGLGGERILDGLVLKIELHYP